MKTRLLIFLVLISLVFLPFASGQQLVGVVAMPSFSLKPGAASYPAADVDEFGRLHLAYAYTPFNYSSQSFSVSDMRVYYTYYDPDEEEFSTPLMISLEKGTAYDPAIHAEKGYVWVTWTQYYYAFEDQPEEYNKEIFLAAFNGTQWIGPVDVSKTLDDHLHHSSIGSTLYVDPEGRVYVFWYEIGRGTYGVYYSVYNRTFADPDYWSSMGDSEAWDGPHLISEEGAYAYQPNGGVDPQGYVHIVYWQRIKGLDWDLFYVKLKDGAIVEGPTKIFDGEKQSVNPKLAVDPLGRLHVFWHEVIQLSGSDKYFAIMWMMNDGSGWSQPVEITNYSGNVLLGRNAQPKMAFTPDGKAYIIWRNPEKDEVYFAYYDGASWSSWINLSNSPGSSAGYSIIADEGGVAHAIFVDNTRGHSELYYGLINGTEVTGFATVQTTLTMSSGGANPPRILPGPGDYDYVIFVSFPVGVYPELEQHIYFMEISPMAAEYKLDNYEVRSLDTTFMSARIYQFVEDFQDRLGSAERAIAVAQEAIAALTSNMSAVQQDLSSLQSWLSEVDQTVSDLSQQVGVLEGRVEDLESSVGTLQDDLQQLADALSALDQRFQDANETLNELVSNFNSLSSTVDNIDSRVSDLASRLDQVESDFQDFKSSQEDQISNLQDSIRAVKLVAYSASVIAIVLALVALALVARK